MSAPVAPELLKLRSANTAYLSILRDAEGWAQQAWEANRVANREYAEQLAGLLDQVRDATLPHESGTPASIARVVGEMLGETEA